MRWKFSLVVLTLALVFVFILYTYDGSITGLQISNNNNAGGSTGGDDTVGSGGDSDFGGINPGSGQQPQSNYPEPTCSDLTTQLLYHFDGIPQFGESNNLVNDFSRNSYTAVCSGDACPNHEVLGGKFLGAFDYDGINDNFRTNSFKLPTTGTIEVWVKPIAAGSIPRMIVWGGESGGDGFGPQNEIHLHYNSNTRKFGFFVEGGATLQSDCILESQNQFQPGQWHHVVARYRLGFAVGPSCELFVNGVSQASSLFSTPNPSNWVNYIYLGRADSISQSNNWRGSIDEVVIYNRELTNQEIITNYNSKEEHCPNKIPIGYHDLNDCNIINGWTCDPDDFTKQLDIHFYTNTSSGVEIFATTKADVQREPTIGNLCGGNSSNVYHGFRFNVPESFKDGKTRAIYAFAINYPPTWNNPLLGASPKIITCSPDPIPPVFNREIPNQILIKKNTHSEVFDLDDYFSDANGDRLVYNHSNTTRHVNITIDDNGDVSFETADWIGVEYVTFTASDGGFTVNSNNITINITNENLPPTITSKNPLQSNLDLEVGRGQVFTITKSDPDNDQLIVSWKLDNNTVIGITGDSYTYTPQFVGTHILTVKVSDTLWDDSFTWTINVKQAQQPTQQPTQQTGFCGDGKKDIGEDCSTCSVDVKCSSSAVCRSGVCVPIEEQKPQRSNILLTLGLIILIIFLILVILVVVYNIVKKKAKKKPQEPQMRQQIKQEIQNTKQLEDYIRRALASGQTRDQLEITLLANGWTKESVDSAFANVQQPKVTPTITTQEKPKDNRIKNVHLLVDYLKKVQSRGYTRTQIEPVLLKRGWPKDVIEEAFKQANI